MKFLLNASAGILAIILLVSSSAVAQEPKQLSITHRLHSAQVGDEFIIDVHLPHSYHDSEDAYPVIVVLDGDKSSGMACDIVDWLSSFGEIPKLVVVAISYGGSFEDWWSKRSRDLSPTKDSTNLWGEFPLAGGADAFRSFIRNELIPFVEENYRISTDRTLAGLSLGGLFATYVLFSEPDLFKRYIISGAALIWDNRRIWQHEIQYRDKHTALDAIVFTAAGSLESANILDPWEEFNQLIETRDYEGLKWTAHQFEGESHFSCWPMAFTRGLKVVYSEP